MKKLIFISVFILSAITFICIQKSFSNNKNNWTLAINEFLAINNTVNQDEYGEFDDWLEIYNFGDDTVNIFGLYITDDLSEPDKWQILAQLTIIPDSFIIFWADGQPEQGDLHLNFKLSGSGEEIGIFTPDNLTLIDFFIFNHQNEDISQGRQPDGSSTWNFFTVPTPCSSNTTQGMFGNTPEPVASVQGGLFYNSFLVELEVSSQNTTIYYTLDYSDPDALSNIYTDPIYIDQTTVLRAIAIQDQYLPSKIISHTYLFNENSTLDIITLVTDPSNFWGSSGIYSNPNNGLEKPIHIEYIKNSGELGFSINAGVKIHSPDTRGQKSLRFYIRSQYGIDKLNYKLFDDKNISGFKRFILRNGGNDGLELGKSQIRDPLIHILYKQCTPSNAMASYKPVTVF
ncbi:MAG: chitobiase/beta-hexosaminidase C-terminal domain-containing protein, partial [Bacteroidales bacterium]|nr:chitobiase/beta-hexosaminidase C-terminal domain-containing protein [Bacteroidales bacterium]